MKKSNEEIDKLTHKIIGCAMQVHRTLGNGFQEVTYQGVSIVYSYNPFNRVQDELGIVPPFKVEK